ncbi:hypothetical protein Tco_0327474 [Tanacetum coccineum]
MRGFLWCQRDLRKGKAKVAWEAVCLPNCEGGLGIRRWKILIRLLLHLIYGVLFRLRSRYRHRIGDGSMISAWFDNWCSISPLSNIIPNRDIYAARFQLSSNISELIVNGNWVWPNDWHVKFLSLSNISVPHLYNAADGLCWKNHCNVDSGFFVAAGWDCIRPRGTKIDWYHLGLPWVDYLGFRSEFALGYACREEYQLRVLVILVEWHVTYRLVVVQALLEVNVVLLSHSIVHKLSRD